MSDEHRADFTPWEQHPIVRMPFLQSLAETGVVFRNAYTPAPICIPARQSMACGKFPRHCGVERYGQDLPPFAMTFARRLSQYGYATVCAGKLHHLGPDQMQGWTQRIGNNMHVSPGHIGGKNQEAYTRFWKAHSDARDRGEGKWPDAKEVRQAGVGSFHEAMDGYTLQGALNYIQQTFTDIWYDRPAKHVPQLLKVSFSRPHYPYQTSEEKLTYYLNRVEPFLEEETFDHPFLSRHQVKPGEDASEREIRRATAAYCGMIEEIDEDFSAVYRALRNAGETLDDWIVIYCSDHGEMLGQHGIWEKQQFFEASVRVPLIIRFPRRFSPRIVEENVNLCDLFATLCELTGAPLPEGEDAPGDSRSLIPLMEGKNEGWMNETISQFDGTNLMIKQDHLKYCYFGPEMPQVLFDLQRDPKEIVNFFDDPAYTQAICRFQERQRELDFG